MNVIEIPIDSITPASWNPNELPDEMRARLRRSMELFGLVVPLVVRELDDGTYETVGGAHRLEIALGMGFEKIPCVVVDVDDADARLLSQALNHIAGEDNLGLRAALIKEVLEEKPMEEVLSLLPDSAESLTALSSLGEEDLAAGLAQWQAEQAARLKHMTFQLVPSQLEVVEEALERAGQDVQRDDGNPNRRGVALYSLAKRFLDSEGRSMP